MDIIFQNLTSQPLYLGDFYLQLAANETRTLTGRGVGELQSAPSVSLRVQDGSLAVTPVYTPDEKAAGFLTPPATVGFTDLAPVDVTELGSGVVLIRKPLVAGGGGSADDVVAYAVNTLPFKCRVVDVWAFISAGAAAARTVSVRTAAAGGGTEIGRVGADTAGRQGMAAAITATQVLTPGATVGLFLRRSDSAIAGELFILARREN